MAYELHPDNLPGEGGQPKSAGEVSHPDWAGKVGQIEQAREAGRAS